MKKNLILGVAGVLTALSLAGCSSSGASNDNPAATTGTLRVTVPNFPANNDGQAAFQKVVDHFHQTYPNVKVEPDYVTFNNLNQKLTTSIASGQVYDVIMSGVGWIPPLADRGVIQDMTKLGVQQADVEQEIGKNSPFMDAVMVKDSVYGMPLVANPRLLAYSKSAFAKAGLDPAKVPQSLDEVRADAKALTVRDASGKVTQEGFDFWAASGNYRQQFVAALGALGEPLFKDGKQNFNNVAGEKALTWMTDVISTDKSSEYGVQNSGQTAMVTTGEAAMGFVGPYVDCSDKGIGQAKCNDLVFFNLKDTKEAMFTGGQIASVGAGTKLAKPALEFIKVLRDESTLESLSSLNVGIPLSTSDAATKFVQSNPASTFAQKSLQSAVFEGGTTNWLTLRTNFGPTLDEAILKRQSAKQVLEGLEVTAQAK